MYEHNARPPAGSGPVTDNPPVPVAIIGMGCRFPGAAGVDEFWNVLSGAAEPSRGAPADRMELTPACTGGPTTGPGSNLLAGVDLFDAEFFGISPREAARLDPQQRLLLETSWEALEDAGVPPRSLAGSRTGVFVGQVAGHYWDLLRDAGVRDLQAYTGAGSRATVAGRLSFTLDLRGPSFALDTACSSSLAAVHLACQSLRAGESTLAMAGAASLILAPDESISFAGAGMLADDGRCRFGDAAARGFARSEGVGMIVLKLLPAAQADGDRVYAVLRGSAVTNDGRGATSIATPSRASQVDMLQAACANAGVRPSDVDYVEAHGTGTATGDEVELGALADFFGAADGRDAGTGPLLIGSVKSVIGHAEGAAGLAGLIKTALCLHRRTLVPTRHVRDVNPVLAGTDPPLRLVREMRAWPDSGPSVAGVSAFGVSGVNVHLLLGAAAAVPDRRRDQRGFGPPPAASPAAPAVISSSAIGGPHLLPLSAHSPAALRDQARRYGDFLAGGPAAALADVCFTATARRSRHAVRHAVVGTSREELLEQLDAVAADPSSAPRSTSKPRVVFVFPGHGSQWVAMGRRLLATSAPFRATLRACDELIRRHLGWSVIDRIVRAAPLDDIAVAHPMLWAVEVSLAAVWRDWGIEPDAVVGHSMGEIAAAHVAGILSLADAAAVVCHRSRLMGVLAADGTMSMASIGVDERTAEALAATHPGLAVAACNSAGSTVLAGPRTALDEVLGSLAGTVACHPIDIAVASHSRHVEPVLGELIAGLGGITPRNAALTMISTVTGEEVGGQELDAQYWATNLRSTVRLSAVLRAVAAGERTVFIEVSPHPVLVPAIRDDLDDVAPASTVIGTLRRGAAEETSLLRSIAESWRQGCEPRWPGSVPAGRVLSLPHYPWQRRSHWVHDAVRLGGGAPVGTDPVATRPPELPARRLAGRTAPVSVPPRRLAGRAAPVSGTDVPARRLVGRATSVWRGRQAARAGLAAVTPPPIPAQTRPQPLDAALLRCVSEVLGLPVDDIDPTVPLVAMGLDSLLAHELRQAFERATGVRIMPRDLLGGVTPADLVAAAQQRNVQPASAA